MAFIFVRSTFSGYSRKFAVRFSVFMSLPAIIGAFFTEVGYFGSSEMTVGSGIFIYFCDDRFRIRGMSGDPEHDFACAEGETALFCILFFYNRGGCSDYKFCLGGEPEYGNIKK